MKFDLRMSKIPKTNKILVHKYTGHKDNTNVHMYIPMFIYISKFFLTVHIYVLKIKIKGSEMYTFKYILIQTNLLHINILQLLFKNA